MQTIFEKRLTPSEKERHWIIIPAKIRNQFPAQGVYFALVADNKTYSTYMDSYNKLRLGFDIFHTLDLDEPGVYAIFEKGSNEEYRLRKRKGLEQIEHSGRNPHV